MIVPMKKICLVVMNKYREDSLEKLREVGVLHLEQKNVSSDTLSKLLDRKAKVENAIAILGLYQTKVKAQKQEMQTNASVFHAISVADGNEQDIVLNILELEEKRKSLDEKASFISWEQSKLKGWGSFNPSDIRFLEENGIVLNLYEFTPKAFKALPANIPYIVANRTNTTVYVVVIGMEVPGETPLAIGEYSLSELNSQFDEIQSQIADINNQLISLFSSKQILTKELETLLEQIEFETANASMEILEDVSAESTVSWIYGFAPSEAVDNLKLAAKKNGWALSFQDPVPGVSPPTLLKNNPLVRLIQPLFSFLGTTPGYREYDISASYLIFFSIFFAMIFGDAAYGLIIFAMAVTIGIKFKTQDGKLPDVAKFLMLLASTTIIWGTITGSWFMAPHESLPAFLSALILPPFNRTGPLMEFPLFLQHLFRLPAEVPVDEFKTRWAIQFLCFTLAVFQLGWARLKRVTNLLPSLTAVAQAGWFMIMLGLYFVVLFMLLGLQLPGFIPPLIGTGFVIVLMFSEQKGGNFLKNMAKGLNPIYIFQTFLKFVGCFADVISYIRLFAVGMAGFLIGQVFNQMAIPVDGFGGFGLGFLLRLIAMLLILVLGHGLNFALTCLSVIAHGVRLNLLEYAGNHLDMEWSGYEYKPFASKQRNKQL